MVMSENNEGRFPSEIVVAYEYCNLGGVATIFKNRVSALREFGCTIPFRFIFNKDNGGAPDLVRLSGVTVEIANSDDFPAHVAASVTGIDVPVIVIDNPKLFEAIKSVAQHVFYEVHTSIPKALGAMQMADFSSVEKMLCVSNWVKERIEQLRVRVDIEKIDVVGNFVETALFSPPEPGDRPASPGGRRPVIWIGKLNHDKGVHEFQNIVRLIGDLDVDVTFVTGGGLLPVAVSEFLSFVTVMGRRLPVRWLHNLDHGSVSALMKSCALGRGILVSTSRFESFGLAVLEAMQTGVPVVAAGVGGLLELLDGCPDLLYECGDIVDADRKIRCLLADTESYSDAVSRVLAGAARYNRDAAVRSYARFLGFAIDDVHGFLP